MFGTFSEEYPPSDLPVKIKRWSGNPMDPSTFLRRYPGHQIVDNLYILWRYLDPYTGKVPLVLEVSKYGIFSPTQREPGTLTTSTFWPSCFEESVERNKRDPLGRDRGRIFSYHTQMLHGTGIFTYIYHTFKPNGLVNIPCPMEHLGIVGWPILIRIFSFSGYIDPPYFLSTCRLLEVGFSVCEIFCQQGQHEKYIKPCVFLWINTNQLVQGFSHH